MPTWLAHHTPLLQGRRYPGARDLCAGTRYGCCSHSIINCFVQETIFECTAALDEIRPHGHGFGCGDGSCIDWHQRHAVRVFSTLSSAMGITIESFPLVVWLSSLRLRGVRSCGSRHGLGVSVLVALGSAWAVRF